MTYEVTSNKDVINNYGHGETTAYLLLETPSYPALVLWSNIGTLGKGVNLGYPCSRVPAHPLRALGACALGSNLCELGV